MNLGKIFMIYLLNMWSLPYWFLLEIVTQTYLVLCNWSNVYHMVNCKKNWLLEGDKKNYFRKMRKVINKSIDYQENIWSHSIMNVIGEKRCRISKALVKRDKNNKTTT